MNRKQEIKQGILIFPKQIIELCKLQDKAVILQEMFDSLFYNFLIQSTTDTLIWVERIGEIEMIQVLSHLSKSGWVTSKVENNFAMIELNRDKLLKWVTEEDITKLMYDVKVRKHSLTYSKSTVTDLVSVNHSYNANANTMTKQYKKTGLVRKGFAKAGNNPFEFDVISMLRYKDLIIEQLVKSQVASTKEVIHPEVIASVIENYIILHEEYTLGFNISDSRGRAIFEAIRKVFNPVSCKEARALVVLPKYKQYKLDSIGEEAVFACIAQTLGSKLLGKEYDTYEEKVGLGQIAYLSRTMPKLTLDSLHEYILIDRIYDNLDRHNIYDEDWKVSIELDATASAVSLMGVLTNDHTFMELTNLTGNKLQDAWTVDYVSRTHIKKAVTPAIYGSSATANQLWDKAKLEYTQEQLNDMNYDLTLGRYANAIRFKDHIINNVQTKAEMNVHVWNDKFTVYCNKFQWESTTTQAFRVYESSGKVKRITREVAMKPNLEAFKRYFCTLLIHGIDSQIADNICENMDWVLPIHDAFLIAPNDTLDLKELYLSNIVDIYDNRKEILSNYFNSIGIEEMYEEVNTEEVAYFSGSNLK